MIRGGGKMDLTRSSSSLLGRFLVVMVLSIVPSLARADGWIGANVGLTMPTSGRVADTGYGGAVKGSSFGAFYSTDSASVRATLDIGFHRYDNLTATSVRGRLVYLAPHERGARPYVVAGVGIWRLSTDSGIRGTPALDMGLGFWVPIPSRHAAAFEATFAPMANGEPSVFLLGLRLMTRLSASGAR